MPANILKGKTQNIVKRDIDKIISTFENRTEEEIQPPCALSEVETNDYNLNIPRYVDTFEEEEAIDLKAITTELRELAVLADTTDATIEGFCTELGIEPHFNDEQVQQVI
jgi:type I restriction enzyme M protein